MGGKKKLKEIMFYDIITMPLVLCWERVLSCSAGSEGSLKLRGCIFLSDSGLSLTGTMVSGFRVVLEKYRYTDCIWEGCFYLVGVTVRRVWYC